MFSTYVPYILATLGMFYTGKFPEDYYGDISEYEFLDNSFLIEVLIVAAIIVAVYVLCRFFAKKVSPMGLLRQPCCFALTQPVTQ